MQNSRRTIVTAQSAGEERELCAAVKAGSVLGFNALLMAVLSAMPAYLCVSMHAQGMLMEGLLIPCGPRWLALLCNQQSSEPELC